MEIAKEGQEVMEQTSYYELKEEEGKKKNLLWLNFSLFIVLLVFVTFVCHVFQPKNMVVRNDILEEVGVGTADFTRIGEGYCRDEEDKNPWQFVSYCLDKSADGLETCKQKCLQTTDCVCISYAESPNDDMDGCRLDGKARCNVYTGNGVDAKPFQGSERASYIAYRLNQEEVSVASAIKNEELQVGDFCIMGDRRKRGGPCYCDPGYIGDLCQFRKDPNNPICYGDNQCSSKRCGSKIHKVGNGFIRTMQQKKCIGGICRCVAVNLGYNPSVIYPAAGSGGCGATR